MFAILQKLISYVMKKFSFSEPSILNGKILDYQIKDTQGITVL